MIDRVLDIPVELTLSVEDAILIAATVSTSHDAMPPGSVGDTKYAVINQVVIQAVSRAIVDQGWDPGEAKILMIEMNKALAILALPDR